LITEATISFKHPNFATVVIRKLLPFNFSKTMIRFWIHPTRTKNAHLRSVFLFTLTLFFVFFINSCDEDGLEPVSNSIEMNPKLSDYNIFQGNPAELIPSADYHLYELTTELFTDYAEKQRLIKIPSGYKIPFTGGGLPDFPDGTILVKTFYYYNDKRDASKGKKIVETRLEIKSNSIWNVNTYLWNEQQTDAVLITTGLDMTINWIDQQGRGKVISYHVPSNRECSTCHHSSGKIVPIGPKLRNLNRDVTRNETTINQLTHFHHLGILDIVDPTTIPVLPDWQDNSYSLEERARAYLDVNCAHCHNPDGMATDANVNFVYETSFGSTNIGDKKRVIVNKMKRGEMPRIGTSIVHEEGLELIRSYINSL
jgi:uncharacterized repeat protein (TIGR03806 family)